MSADNWGDCPKCGTKKFLREDYEVGFWHNYPDKVLEFGVHYSGICKADGCGYTENFKHTENP